MTAVIKTHSVYVLKAMVGVKVVAKFVTMVFTKSRLLMLPVQLAPLAAQQRHRERFHDRLVFQMWATMRVQERFKHVPIYVCLLL